MISNIVNENETQELLLDTTAAQSMWIQKQQDEYADAQMNRNIFYRMMYENMIKASSNLKESETEIS